MRLHWVAWLVGFSWLVPGGPGCDGGSVDTGNAGCPPGVSAEIGTGTEGFEPIPEGGTLEIVRGPQGGYHLLGAFRGCGLTEGSLILRFEAVETESGDVVTDVTYTRQSRPDGSCCLYVADLYGYLSLPGTGYYGDPAQALDGKRLAITMTVSDPEGVEVSATRVVLVMAPAER